MAMNEPKPPEARADLKRFLPLLFCLLLLTGTQALVSFGTDRIDQGYKEPTPSAQNLTAQERTELNLRLNALYDRWRHQSRLDIHPEAMDFLADSNLREVCFYDARDRALLFEANLHGHAMYGACRQSMNDFDDQHPAGAWVFPFAPTTPEIAPLWWEKPAPIPVVWIEGRYHPEAFNGYALKDLGEMLRLAMFFLTMLALLPLTPVLYRSRLLRRPRLHALPFSVCAGRWVKFFLLSALSSIFLTAVAFIAYKSAPMSLATFLIVVASGPGVIVAQLVGLYRAITESWNPKFLLVGLPAWLTGSLLLLWGWLCFAIALTGFMAD